MRFDPFRSIVRLEKKSPKLARFIAINFLSQLSPFNAHLGAKMVEWSDNSCKIFLKRRRKVCNHVKAIHAGALFTLGETCAGLIIIRNFPFEGFRPLMSDVKVSYFKQGRDDVTGEAHIPSEKIAAMHADLARGEIPKIDVVTDIYDQNRLLIASVTTVWQVKPWKLVQTK